MPVWGHNLFEDDGASDIRSAFGDLLEKGLSPAGAEREMVKLWSPSRRDDPGGYAAFWVILAATKWDLGRLTAPTLKRAAEILGRGIGLDPFGDASPRTIERRRAGYAQVRKKLLGPPPSPKPIPKRSRSKSDWEVGHLISYRTRSGRTVYFRVTAIDEDRGGEYPVLDVMRWTLDRPPTRREAGTAGRAVAKDDPSHEGLESLISIVGTNTRDFPEDRVGVLETKLRLKKHPRGATLGVFLGRWTMLDDHLRTAYAIT